MLERDDRDGNVNWRFLFARTSPSLVVAAASPIQIERDYGATTGKMRLEIVAREGAVGTTFSLLVYFWHMSHLHGI